MATQQFLHSAGLDDIPVIGGEEDDVQEEGDEEEMEEEGEGEWDWIAPFLSKDSNYEKQQGTDIMVVAGEMSEKSGSVPMEMGVDGENEGEKARGTIAASSTSVVKAKRVRSFSMPTSLNDVWMISPVIQQHLIQLFW